MAENKIPLPYAILTVLLIISVTVIGFQAVKIKRLKDRRYTLSPGEDLPALELLNFDNSQFNVDSQGITLLLCFKTPCSACNSNLKLWNSIAKYFENRINIIGIVPDGDPDAYRLVDEKKVLFPLYVPADEQSLRKKLRLVQNMAQTIVIRDNKIVTLRLGELSALDLNALVKTIKQLISTS